MSTATQPYDRVHGLRNYTFGQHLPFPIRNDAHVSGSTVSAVNPSSFAIEGSSGIASAVSYQYLASYRIHSPGTYPIDVIDIVAVNIPTCPVVRDCEDNGHSMLLMLMHDSETQTYTVYDMASVIMNNGVYNCTELTNHSAFAYSRVAIESAIRNVAQSMQWATDLNGSWPYAATVFSGTIDIHMHDDKLSHISVPCGKRQITSGESLHIPSDERLIMTFLVGESDNMEWSYCGDVPASDVEPTVETSDDLDAMRAEIAVLREDRQNAATALDAARQTISNLQSIIDEARNACAVATRENNGCREGKISFLTSTGLWPDASEDDIAELAGFPREREYDVSFTVTFNLMASIEGRPDEIENMDYDDIADMIDVAAYVRSSIYDAEVQINDVEEA